MTFQIQSATPARGAISTLADIYCVQQVLTNLINDARTTHNICDSPLSRCASRIRSWRCLFSISKNVPFSLSVCLVIKRRSDTRKGTGEQAHGEKDTKTNVNSSLQCGNYRNATKSMVATHSTRIAGTGHVGYASGAQLSCGGLPMSAIFRKRK